MAYEFITVTTTHIFAKYGDPIWVPARNTYPGGTLNLGNPDYTFSKTVIQDDDNIFNSGIRAYDPNQVMPAGSTLGSETFTTDQPIFVLDYVIMQDAAKNDYMVLFPLKKSGSTFQVVGGQKIIFIRPLNENITIDHSIGMLSWKQSVRPDPGIVMPEMIDDNDPPCFAKGTLIMTTNGQRAVESLEPGDLILTQDHGYQKLRWVGGTHLDSARLDLSPNLRPLQISAGALGAGLPEQDLVVSPQHRVLARSPIAKRLAGQSDVLVAAKHLTSIPGISVLNRASEVTYYHLLFDRHELVLSNGCWTESLYTGPQMLKRIAPAARREIHALFPDLIRDDRPPLIGARPFLTGKEGRNLALRHYKNQKPLVST